MRRHQMLRTTRAAWVALMLSMTIVLAVTAATASADTVSSLKAQAAAAEAHANALYAVSEQKVQAYDAVHTKYLNTKARYQATLAALKIARQNLKASQAQLAASLTRSYKAGDPDPVAYMLAAKSVSDLVDQVQLYDRANVDNTKLLGQVTTYKKQIATQKATLQKQTADLASQDAASQQAKDSAIASLHSAQAYTANLNAQVRHAIQQQQAARAAAAARAVAAQQQAAATATSTQTTTTTTSTGGGGSSSGGGSGFNGSAPGNSVGGQAVSIAESYLGVPYVYGGASPSGFDCSGLVMYVYAQLGISLPHNAAAQYASLPHISRSQLQPGDLVFFYGFGHVGIYVGGNTVIHAPHTGTVVQFENMDYMGPIAYARP